MSNKPTDITLAGIMQGDQVDAEIEATAGKIGKFYERLLASGIRPKAAENMTHDYMAVVLAQAVNPEGMTIVQWPFGMED